jgi:tRNA (guanine37-N1)-methyltransferase
MASVVLAWGVVVPMDRGEEVRKALRDRGVLLKNLKIQRDADRLVLPTIRRMDVGFPTEQRDFEEGFVAIRSYRDLVRLPEGLQSLLPHAFDVIGDIAVLKIPEELTAHRGEIGEAILAWNRKIGVVAQDRGVAGELRIRKLEIIAGERRTETVHVEHGLRYKVDVARAYFSPRLATERLRVTGEVEPGETVVDPFAGVGPYAILIARRSQPKRVVASDANPVAIKFLRENVAMNRASLVEVREGDARAVLRSIEAADRVILDLPHSAMDFVPDASRSLGLRGFIHVYGIVEAAERGEAVDRIRAAVERGGRSVEDVQVRTVRAYSPTQHHVAFDLKVARG